MRIDTISLIASCFICGFLGIAVLIRNFRSRLYQSFSVFCAVLLARDMLCLMKSFEESSLYSPPIFLFVSLLVGPCSLWWLQELKPEFKNQLRKVRWGYWGFLVLLGLTALMPFYSRVVNLVQALAEASFLIPCYLWTHVLVKSSQSETLPRERIRYRYAIWGLVVVIACHVTDTLYFSEISSVVPVGTLARSLYLIFLFQLFIQRELLTTQELASRICLFGVISLVLSGIYWLLVSWVDSRPGLFLFNTFVASFAILILFEPLKSAVSQLMNKLFLKKNILLEKELNALTEDLRGLVEPGELSKRLASSLKKVLGIEKASLYLLERDGVSYVKADSRLEDISPEVSASSPLIEYMTLRRGRPFVMESLRTDLHAFHSSQGRKFLEDCLETLKQLEADLVIPFIYESKIVGFVAAPLSEKIILSNDLLRLFVPVSRQIALLLRSAQTLTVLRDRDKLATIGEMAAGLAHEIKNPLGAIKGAAELLSEEKDEKVAQDYLKIIQDETNRLSGVLSQFLDYAKPRRHDPQSHCEPLKVIEHTAQLALTDAKVAFSVHTEGPLIEADVDPELLKQVLLNLFLNAVQAMGGASDASLKVVVREIRSKRRWLWGIPLYKVIEGWEKLTEQPIRSIVEIEVQDNGPGIPLHERAKIFVPFFTTKPKGTGLGLAICQRLIESVGGSIQMKPNFPKGTRFILHIPSRVKVHESSEALDWSGASA